VNESEVHKGAITLACTGLEWVLTWKLPAHCEIKYFSPGNQGVGWYAWSPHTHIQTHTHQS